MSSTENNRMENIKVNSIFQIYEECIPVYSSLVEKVLQQELLNNYINNKIKNDPRLINLVTKDWISVFKNNPTLQHYINGNEKFHKYDSPRNKAITIHKVLEYSKNINVIVIGTFKLVADNENSIKLKLIDCGPLQCVAEIMCLSLDKTVLHNALFYINGCKGCCRICREYKETEDNGWCLQCCMVFNNDKLQFATRKFCENLYTNETKVLLHLEINTAYTFSNNCKIGGNVKSMVFIEDIFNDGETNNVCGVLKMDENFLPNEEKNLEELLFEEDNKLPLEEDNNNGKNDAKRMKYHTVSDNAILGIPKGLNFNKPAEKKFEVIEDKSDEMP